MDLRIKNISRIDESVRDVLYEHCQEARRLITENAGDEPHETIHEVRKIFKKIRGVLRLVRDTTDDYQSWNTFFRDEARKISDIRDTTSMMEAIDTLYNQYSGKIYKTAFSHMRSELEKKRLEQEKEYLKEQDILQEIKVNIQLRCGELKELPMDIESFQDVLPGIKRTYKRGRKAFKKASDSNAPEDFHEWRKRVKYLRYQLRAIQPVWPRMWDTLEDELHDLSDGLGEDRDLFMLQNYLHKYQNERTGQQDSDNAGELLITLIEDHRPLLQQRSLILGQKLYHLKPGTFVSLVGAAWSAQLSMDTKTSMRPE